MLAPAAPGVRPGAERAVAGMGQPEAADAATGGELPDVVFDGGYRIPGDIYARLFDYQKTGARGAACACALRGACRGPPAAPCNCNKN